MQPFFSHMSSLALLKQWRLSQEHAEVHLCQQMPAELDWLPNAMTEKNPARGL